MASSLQAVGIVISAIWWTVTRFHFPCSFLLLPQPWSLLTIILLWHSFFIIIKIITSVKWQLLLIFYVWQIY